MSALRRNWGWIAATLVLAVVVHIASVLAVPRAIMGLTMSGLASRAGLNHMVHGARPTAASRGVVRPSPDLLYSTCVFDLTAAHGVVHVRVRGMPKSYWSISLFDADTDNFYVLDDRQAATGAADVLIVGPDWEKPTPWPTVRSPTTRGLVLLRTLITDDAHLAAADAARRHATCTPG